MEELDEIVGEFLVESYENLDKLDQDLLTLEAEGYPREMVAGIFRTVHTIKGTCGFLGYDKLEKVTHVGENLLSKLRDGALTPTSDITNALLALNDAMRSTLNHIEADGTEGEADYTQLVERLTQLAAGESAAATPAATTEEPVHEPPLLGEILIEQGKVEPQDVAEALAEQVAQQDEAQQEATKTTSAISESTVRVDVSLLDSLMQEVGELVLARNQLLQLSANNEDQTWKATVQRLNLITSELQQRVMRTRMQPIGNVWNKYPRIVRDLAAQCEKQVRLEMEGKETELDKTLIEAIRDPLTHIIRNAVDHGIESPEKRAEAGKPLEGVLRLRSFHEGGQVIVEITDDGAGVNVERVKEKAVEKSIITAATAKSLSDHDASMLIFEPGFSTAAALTNISGRGVGMDVVKTAIEAIGGAIELSSEFGTGTTLKLKIPLTLAIIPALLIGVGGKRFAIPQVNLVELVKTNNDSALIEWVAGAPVFRLREKLIPLMFLDSELGLREARTDSLGETFTLVVLNANEKTFGLLVEEVLDTEEIVVKPLSRQLAHLDQFAGATIMGDGEISLILDVVGLAKRASVITQEQRHELLGQEHDTAAAEHSEMMLVATVGSGRQVAFALENVARIDAISTDTVEKSGTDDVIQQRGSILPLVHVRSVIDGATDLGNEHVSVVVYRHDDYEFGLVVKDIVDIVDVVVKNQAKASKSLVIRGKVTDVIEPVKLISGITQGSANRDNELAKSGA